MQPDPDAVTELEAECVHLVDNPKSSASGHTLTIMSVVLPGRTRSMASSIHTRAALGDLTGSDVLIEGTKIVEVEPHLDVDNAKVIDASNTISLTNMARRPRSRFRELLAQDAQGCGLFGADPVAC